MTAYKNLTPDRQEVIKAKARASYLANKPLRARQNYFRMLTRGAVRNPKPDTLTRHNITRGEDGQFSLV